MLTFKKALASSVGKKYLMAASGLLLIGFLLTHMAANLLLYLPEGTAFNMYAKGLKDLGPGLWVLESGLFALFAFHIALGIKLHFASPKGRPEGYIAGQKTKGGASKYGISSNAMKWTGLVLGIFVIGHVAWFRFEIGVTGDYMTMIDGEPARDLYRLVVDTFKSPVWAAGYTAVMVFLFFHLRHGFWSAFQSLGAMAPKYDKLIYAAGIALAGLLTAGFIGLPFFIYFTK